MKIDIEVITPTVPNFLKTPYGVIPIEDLSEDLLKEIGDSWTKALIARAVERKTNKKQT